MLFLLYSFVNCMDFRYQNEPGYFDHKLFQNRKGLQCQGLVTSCCVHCGSAQDSSGHHPSYRIGMMELAAALWDAGLPAGEHHHWRPTVTTDCSDTKWRISFPLASDCPQDPAQPNKTTRSQKCSLVMSPESRVDDNRDHQSHPCCPHVPGRLPVRCRFTIAPRWSGHSH